MTLLVNVQAFVLVAGWTGFPYDPSCLVFCVFVFTVLWASILWTKAAGTQFLFVQCCSVISPFLNLGQ